MKELDQHLEALHNWLLDQKEYQVSTPQLTPEERQRLKKIKEAVELHYKIGISPSEELLEQMRKLEEHTKMPPVPKELASRKEQLDGLIEQLRLLLQAAQALRKQWQGASRFVESGAGGSKKHYGVNLLSLIQAGYLTSEDQLELQWLKNGPTFEGKVQRDGMVQVKTENGWQEYKSLSTAASDLAGRALNGWRHWFKVDPDGSRTCLGEIRDQFLQQGKGG